MLRRSRTTTAVAAAAGLGAAAVASGDEPPQPPVPETATVADALTAGRLVGRLTALQDIVAAHMPALHQRPRRTRPGRFTILQVRKGKRVSLRLKPGGKVAARVGPRTQFGSPETLTVADRRGHWVGVTTSERPNGRLGWVDERSSALEEHRTRVSLRVDLSSRRLTLRDGRARRTVRVGIGGASSPTPTGRFAITDKLPGVRYKGAYGCCVLALSGRQNHTPPGWRGGSRLAIHGSSSPGGFTGSSAGCLRADARTLRKLMRSVPLGTPVFVHR
jgi:lipoprotein-anchoring transpeptidase ErfK/SrfK